MTTMDKREIADAVRQMADRIESGEHRAERFGIGIAEDESRMELTLVVTYPRCLDIPNVHVPLGAEPKAAGVTIDNLIALRSELNAAYVPRCGATCLDCSSFTWNEFRTYYLRGEEELSGGMDCAKGCYTDVNPNGVKTFRELLKRAETCELFTRLNEDVPNEQV